MKLTPFNPANVVTDSLKLYMSQAFIYLELEYENYPTDWDGLCIDIRDFGEAFDRFREYSFFYFRPLQARAYDEDNVLIDTDINGESLNLTVTERIAKFKMQLETKYVQLSGSPTKKVDIRIAPYATDGKDLYIGTPHLLGEESPGDNFIDLSPEITGGGGEPSPGELVQATGTVLDIDGKILIGHETKFIEELDNRDIIQIDNDRRMITNIFADNKLEVDQHWTVKANGQDIFFVGRGVDSFAYKNKLEEEDIPNDFISELQFKPEARAKISKLESDGKLDSDNVTGLGSLSKLDKVDTNEIENYAITDEKLSEDLDDRIEQGEEAYEWGDHSIAEYLKEEDLLDYAKTVDVLLKANNLSGLADKSEARNNLELGALATKNKAILPNDLKISQITLLGTTNINLSVSDITLFKINHKPDWIGKKITVRQGALAEDLIIIGLDIVDKYTVDLNASLDELNYIDGAAEFEITLTEPDITNLFNIDGTINADYIHIKVGGDKYSLQSFIDYFIQEADNNSWDDFTQSDDGVIVPIPQT